MSLISSSSLILEVGRSKTGDDVGKLAFSFRINRLVQLDNAEIEKFKSILINIVNRATEEQQVRRLRKAEDVPGGGQISEVVK
jgi:hypothetical protein